MASIDKRGDGTYRARWREYPGGPQRTRAFTKKADAERFLDVIRGDLARGIYVDPAHGRTLFRDYAETWRRCQMHRPSTAEQAESYLRNHAYPFLGHRPIGAIRRNEIQAWVRGRSEVLGPGSVEVVYRWVATIFKAAVGDRLIQVSPCERIALPKRVPKRVMPLAVDDVERMADAVPERYRALILFAAGTGLRQGECFGVTIDRIDFLRRHVTVDRQMLGARAGAPTFGPPKTQASYRTVPLPESIVEVLAAHVATFRPGRDGLVFLNSHRDPLRRSAFGETWHRAASTAKIPTWATFHDLRHFYASLLIASGCSIKTVQHRLGHQSATETLDTYSHLWPDNDDQTRAAIDRVFGRRSDATTKATPSA